MGADYYAVSTTRKEALLLPRKLGGYVSYNCDPEPGGGGVLTPDALESGRRDYLEALAECPGLPWVPPSIWDALTRWLAEEPGNATLHSDVRDFPRPWKSDPTWQVGDMQGGE